MKNAREDKDEKTRKMVAIDVGEEWVWRQDVQKPKAIELLLRLARDDAREVRYAAVYYGLSTVRNKDGKVVRRLLEIAFKDREPNLYGRIVWGLRDDRAKTAEVLVEYLNGNDPDRGRPPAKSSKTWPARDPPPSP